jgi:alpha-tubulin suppressor-like RCC1 family protein
MTRSRGASSRLERCSVPLVLGVVLGASFGCATPRKPSRSTRDGAGVTSRPAASEPGTPAAPSASAPLAHAAAGSPESHRLCVGGSHTCFVDREHSLWCWGGNYYGAVGVGTHGFGGRMENMDSAHAAVKLPALVPSLEHRVRDVGCGSGGTCAVTLDGRLYCWGQGEGREVLQDFTDSPLPRDIGGKVLALALEREHGCALREDRTLWCWGANTYGALGHGPRGPGEKPGYNPATEVKGLRAAVVAAAVLEVASCALLADASIWCWGGNDQGELGDGSFEQRYEPVEVSPSLRFGALAGGATHACAFTLEHRLLCWGTDVYGQLGNGEIPKTKRPFFPTPQAVSYEFSELRSLDLGTEETLAVDGNGELYAWGDQRWGLRGVAPAPNPKPHRVPLPGRAVEIRANETHRCTLLEDDSVWCWGNGENYALGNGSDENHTEPVRVVFPK